MFIELHITHMLSCNATINRLFEYSPLFCLCKHRPTTLTKLHRLQTRLNEHRDCIRRQDIASLLARHFTDFGYKTEYFGIEISHISGDIEKSSLKRKHFLKLEQNIQSLCKKCCYYLNLIFTVLLMAACQMSTVYT